MDLDKLHRILRATTVQLKKGEETVEHEEGNLKVTEIFVMPRESQVNNLIKVDCYFLTIGVDEEKAKAWKDALVEILKTYPDPSRLAGGPSYIEVGGVIGDQGAAFQLFALGKVLGLWSIITPATLRIPEPQARQMAGMGFVMISGFKP